jgi:uncharacterized protein (DUF488 family)
MIYSIGYSKWTIEQLLKVIEDKKVDMLVDLRSTPFGRFSPPFNRPNLERVLKGRYVWKGHILGGKYGPVKDEGIEWLVARKTSDGAPRNIIIMCVEMDPRQCHRLTDVSARLMLEHGIDVVHILDTGVEHPTSYYLGNLGGT